MNVSKSNGPDDISARMLKATSASIAPSVTSLFNQSLKLGRVPMKWKESRVVPIPKVPAPKSPDNYRPISLLSVLSKALEKHVYRLIASHLDTIPLSDSQWGFRTGRSTVSALLAIVDDWLKLLEEGKEICATFFDYQKAFDSVPHRPLMEKLLSLDLNPYLSRWISDYLTHRSQQVVVDGATSSAMQVLSGVPQGSILGPLLFLIYVDGITDASLSQGSQLSLFADDVLHYRAISKQEDFDTTQSDINIIAKWSDDNFLKLNPKKCKFMIISRKRQHSITPPQLLLNGHPLDEVSTFKYLGVLLSSDMSWSPHISAICSKARKVIGLLYRRFYSMSNMDTLIQLYVSLVRPHLEYACSVWAPASHKDIDSLEGLQKFAFRMATHNWNLNYQDLLSLVDLPTLESRRLQLKLGHLFKIVHGLCFFPSGIVSFREQIHHSCRSIHPLTLQQPFAHTQAYSQSFVPHTCSLWNSLPYEVVSLPSFVSFKRCIQNYY